jgi:sugar lactone lactonase YvrE
MGLLTASAQARPGDLWVGDAGNSKVFRIDPDTGEHHTVAKGGDLVSPDSGAFKANGDFLIADYDAFGGAILRIDGDNHDVSKFADVAALVGPTDVALRGNAVYAADPFAGTGGNGAIFDVDEPGTDATIISDGQLFNGGPLGLAILPSGKILTADQDAGPDDSGALIKVNPTNGNQSFVTSGGKLESPYGMTMSANNNYAYLAEQVTPGRIVRVKIDSGAQKVIAKGNKLAGVTDVALGLDGMLYATNDSLDPQIVRVNPATGKLKTVTDGAFLDAPEGITVEPR